ncbi:uncharacterized protein LTR77_004862 [Saxophila tyrrhenica]|uniref:Cytochrome c oxidase assembly protein n=1 Tax=Saxophila tyrrhenica TaxID=1690608 RepID=A0AAV9PAZ7_9PEZI|nr:hypothetical protein LTR77_004862 [Saxophila tyrrhenica]
MPSSCNDIRAALASCLQNSDCVLVHRNTPADCLRPPLADTLPTQCQQLKHGYGQCKRGMIDMRKRFRGNKPISTSLELEGESADLDKTEVPMLYAGKGGFEGVGPRKTDGREKSEEEMEKAGFERFVRNDGSVDWRKK